LRDGHAFATEAENATPGKHNSEVLGTATVSKNGLTQCENRSEYEESNFDTDFVQKNTAKQGQDSVW